MTQRRHKRDVRTRRKHMQGVEKPRDTRDLKVGKKA